MTICFICKKSIPENKYAVFSFDEASDGYFAIGTKEIEKQGLSVTVCDECQRRIIINEITRILKEDIGSVQPKKKEKKGGLNRIMMMLGGEE